MVAYFNFIPIIYYYIHTEYYIWEKSLYSFNPVAWKQ